MDDDLKWLSIAASVFFICMCINLSIESYCNKQINQLAIENGYIQKVEDREVIWIKEEK